MSDSKLCMTAPEFHSGFFYPDQYAVKRLNCYDKIKSIIQPNVFSKFSTINDICVYLRLLLAFINQLYSIEFKNVNNLEKDEQKNFLFHPKVYHKKFKNAVRVPSIVRSSFRFKPTIFEHEQHSSVNYGTRPSRGSGIAFRQFSA